jgi:hypothetical protein
LNFGASDYIVPDYGYSRLLFDLDLELLREGIADGTISTGCTTGMTHVLQMTNTSSFDNELLNTVMSNSRRRATSFDLILFRIPKLQVVQVTHNFGMRVWDMTTMTLTYLKTVQMVVLHPLLM